MPLRDRIVALRPPRIAMSLVAAAAAAHLLFPLVVLPPSVSGGMLLGTAGFALMIRAWWLFRRVGTPICPTHDATTLLTGDVYGFTRNPMYLGMVIAMLGIAGILSAVSVFVPIVVFVAIIHYRFILHEERFMEGLFGDEYLAYKNQVRRWF